MEFYGRILSSSIKELIGNKDRDVEDLDFMPSIVIDLRFKESSCTFFMLRDRLLQVACDPNFWTDKNEGSKWIYNLVYYCN